MKTTACDYWLDKLNTVAILLLIQPTAFGNSLANSITSNTVMDANQVQADPETDSRGREYKAKDAERQGNTGVAAAIATGSALAAAAVPLLASILPFERAAGADLMAKAGLEFAQAGATGASASDNGAQKDLLTNQANAGGNGAQLQGKVNGSAIKSPQLDQLLGERGINSEDFKNRLVNGEFQTANDVLNAMGDTSNFTPEDFAAGADLAGKQLNFVFGKPEPNGSVENAEYATNENRGISDDSPSFSVESSPLTAAAGQSGSQSAHSSLELPQTFERKVNALAQKFTAPGAAQKDPLAVGFDASAVLKSIMGSGARASNAVLGAKQLVRETLEKIGVLVPPPKQNIFQMAHRNYRSFGKWRRATRIAFVKPLSK